ncbi:MAG: DNA mismatch repair endonuclease MutL [Ignavibacteria bacterium]|nr:DNA mismatch repair endonuclease MutL [Ignavibacteria bacterium]
MPRKIKILPQSIANRIAAGEVVTRPDSAVKELIENSIDAGANEITLNIKDSGKTLIQVIDNGSGMNQEDALMCFQRHSTSKISEPEDLDCINTLGFRGEALASICSVSQIELKTRTKDSEVGTYVKIEGNELIDTSETVCPVGTNVTVKNLFYNTPARRNFLKSNQTEFKHIYDTFIRMAISHPEITFIFINNDSEIFNLTKSNLINRLDDIYAGHISTSLLKLESGNAVISVKGYISKPNFVKKSKQEQLFFLNKRYIYSKNLSFALYSSYDHLIEKGNYPAFFIFIDIDPHKVDVNVHPSKLEVRFDEENAVFGFLRNAVKETLKKADLTFEIGFENTLSLPDSDEKIIHSISTEKTFSGTKQNTPNIFELSSDRKISTEDTGSQSREFPDEEKQSNIFEHQRKSESESFNVWQYQNKYIMCQTETGLMIIDQHAAHERIIYEKAKKMMKTHSSFSQQLLISLKIKLSKLDYQLCTNLKDELRDLGFNINLTDGDLIEITGIPFDVRIGEEHKILEDILNQYKEYEMKLNLEKRDNIAKSFACKSAIKTGDKVSKTEMLNLIDSLFACEMPYVCPHGRPTVVRITTTELDKRFSRT